MNQFNGGRYLDDLTTLLIWMLLGITNSPLAIKEKQQLLSLLRVSTTDDKYRFHNPNLQHLLHRVCGQEGDQTSSIAWFYREYAMRWMEQCLTPNNCMFTKRSAVYFFELLLELAKWDALLCRVAKMMMMFPKLTFTGEVHAGFEELNGRARLFLVQLVKNG